jgi:tetratricopeptide (TPR) repeat protein
MSTSMRGRRRGSSPARLVSIGLVSALGLSLASCGTTRRDAAAPAPARAAASQDSWRDAIAHLNRGDAAAARRVLAEALQRDRRDNIAQMLLRQIDTDPRQLLGAENYSYTVREGETLSTIAQRALGDPMLFYALARYNNIAVPTSVVPGQTILVPGRRPAPPPPRRETPRAAPPRAAQEPGRTTPAPRPAARGNPAQAARLRGQGLAALNAGSVDRAVALLRQALAQDPNNAAIRNDLNRALRVQSTVRSRR